MKLIEKKLYLTIAEMVECGQSEKYLWKAKSEGVKCWHFINDPADKRKVLIGYEDLKDNYKKMVVERFGNPYDMVARLPILDMITQDAKANEYYKQYRYGTDKYLHIGVVNKYTRAASWLNMLGTVQADRHLIKKDMGLSIPEFYEHAGILISDEKKNGKSSTYDGIYTLPGDFPGTYQRLMGKVKAYQDGGYDSLIDDMYGNKVAAKLGKTADGFDAELERKQIAVIRKVAAMHNNFDAAQVAQFSNLVFEKNGWHTLSDSRVYQLLQENKALLTAGRRGRRTYNSEVAMQVKRTAPTYPLAYWTLDGWTVELLYQDKEGFNNRLVMVVVLDAFNKYPIGYAIGERETADLIKAANRNALEHVRELLGDSYAPHQLQSDRYAIKKMTPFYQAVAHLHVPAAAGNAKAKIIEPYFKHLNKTYCQTQANWSGFNITASKKNQVNTEMLNAIKHSFPNKAAVIQQIQSIIHCERKQKLEAYLKGWEAIAPEDKNIMTAIDHFLVFGQPIGGTNRITGQGIIKQINGQQYTYDSFEPAFRQHLQTDWTIVADTEDLSHVLALNNEKKLAFVLHQKMEIPMDIRSTGDEHREYLHNINQYNKDRVQDIIQTYTEDAEIVREIVSNTPLGIDDYQEAALKLMFTDKRGQQKEGIQDAKRLKAIESTADKQEAAAAKQVQQDWQAMQEAYLKEKTNFNQYLD